MFGTIDLNEQRDEWIELEKLTKIYTGTTPSSTDDSNWNGDILWITPAEIKNDSFYIYDTVRKLTEKGRKSKALEIMPINTRFAINTCAHWQGCNSWGTYGVQPRV